MARLALALLLLLAVSASVSASAAGGGSHSHLDLDLGFLSSSSPSGGRRECRGTVAECLAEDSDEEEGMESHRRALYSGGYISYGALRRDNVPCSRRGASYYNCRPGGQANPYHRGCSRITRCRG